MYSHRVELPLVNEIVTEQELEEQQDQPANNEENKLIWSFKYVEEN